jgi:hypothetical protein
MNEVGVNVDIQALGERVPHQPGQLRVQGRLAANELDDLHAERCSLNDNPLPVQGGHRPAPAVRAAFGVAVSAFELTELRDLQFQERRDADARRLCSR